MKEEVCKKLIIQPQRVFVAALYWQQLMLQLKSHLTALNVLFWSSELEGKLCT